MGRPLCQLILHIYTLIMHHSVRDEGVQTCSAPVLRALMLILLSFKEFSHR